VATIRISAEYDPEAGVWVAQSSDIPLVTEAASVEALRAKLPGMILDLIEDHDQEIKVELTTHSFDSVLANKAA
jgi:hypothetical protein